MRHVTGLHEADAFRDNRRPRLWKTPAVMILAGVTMVLLAAGGVLSAIANGDHTDSVFDWADLINHASVICLVVVVVIVYRMHRAVLRAMDAASKAVGLPGPGEPASSDRKAA